MAVVKVSQVLFAGLTRNTNDPHMWINKTCTTQNLYIICPIICLNCIEKVAKQMANINIIIIYTSISSDKGNNML